MSAAPIVMVLSTGRCGTQWLASGLRELHPEVRVAHEPIGPLYAPRRHFREWDQPDRVLAEPAVARHLAALDARDGLYVETGWPAFAALPHMAARWGERLRVIHLTRHPVPTACSHLAHSSYAGSGREDAFTQLATLGPEDPHVFQAGYGARWRSMSGYERCLYWITEVSLFGLEFPEKAPIIPFMRLRSEDLLAGEVEPLLRFIGLEPAPGWAERVRHTVDRWHHHTDETVEPERIAEHPLALAAAERLGYDPTAFDREALHARYAGKPDPGEDRHGRYAEA